SRSPLAARSAELARVHQGRRQRTVIDHRTRTRPPDGAGVGLVELRRVIAEPLEAVAPLDQRQPVAEKALQLDGLHLGAVLLSLAAALRLLVVIERAPDRVQAPVKRVDHGPE